MQPEGNGTSGSGRPGRRKSWPGEPRRGCEEGMPPSWHVQGQQGGPGRGGWGRRVQIAQESTAGSENNSRPAAQALTRSGGSTTPAVATATLKQLPRGPSPGAGPSQLL